MLHILRQLISAEIFHFALHNALDFSYGVVYGIFDGVCERRLIFHKTFINHHVQHFLIAVHGYFYFSPAAGSFRAFLCERALYAFGAFADVFELFEFIEHS